MDVDFEQYPGYLNVAARGMFTIEEAVAAFQEILDRCLSTGQTSVLIDFAKLDGIDYATLRVIFALSARERYDRYLAHDGLPLRMAFVADPHSYLSWQPGMEAVSQNAQNVQTFIDRQAALDWLSA